MNSFYRFSDTKVFQFLFECSNDSPECTGASDPYVKIKCSGRLLHKSRTVHRELNPIWDESVTLPIEDPFQPLNIKVIGFFFHRSFFKNTQLMGETKVDIEFTMP